MYSVGLTSDDELLVEHYYLHWLEMGVAEHDIRDDWRAEAARFIRVARARDGFAGFATKDDGVTIGTACCQLAPRVFPVFRNSDAARVGYIWGLYVSPGFRGRGTGEALLRSCMSHLRELECGRVLLHAGERSAALYGRLGFEPTDEFGTCV